MGYTEVFNEETSEEIKDYFTKMIKEMRNKGFSYAEIKYHLDKIYSVAEYINYIDEIVD